MDSKEGRRQKNGLDLVVRVVGTSPLSFDVEEGTFLAVPSKGLQSDLQEATKVLGSAENYKVPRGAERSAINEIRGRELNN